MRILVAGCLCGCVAAIAAIVVAQQRLRQRLRMPRLVLAIVCLAAPSCASRPPQPMADESRAARDVGQAFMSDPSLAIIAKRHPDLAARFRAKVRPAVMSGDSEATAAATEAAMGEMLAWLTPKYGDSIPDSELVALWRPWYSATKRVAESDSAAAFEIFIGQRSAPGDSVFSYPVMLHAIAAAIQHPAPPADPKKVEAIRAGIFERLNAKYGLDPRALDASKLDPSEILQAELEYWDEIMALPDSEATPYLRTYVSISKLSAASNAGRAPQDR